MRRSIPVPSVVRRSFAYRWARAAAKRAVSWAGQVNGARQVTVRAAGPGQVRVSRRTYRLDDPAARYALPAGTLRLWLPDPPALVQLATAGLLTGQIRHLRVRLARAPEWLATGARPPRPGPYTTRFGWRRRGGRLGVHFGWSRPYPVHRALADALAAVVRARPWDQVSGPVYALDRTVWLEGGCTWPHGRLVAARPDVTPDARGRPLGPYISADGPRGGRCSPLVTTVANPYGRVLTGAAAPYRLSCEPGRLVLRDGAGQAVLCLDHDASAEAAVASGNWSRYAVVQVDGPVPGEPFAAHALQALGACGAVFAAADPYVRAELTALGLVTSRDPREVTDLNGYALSVEAARVMATAGDAALRRTVLNGGGTLPLPAVSALLASKRPDDIETCLGYLAYQTYPALEVLVGMHGYDVDEPTRRRWQDRLPFPLRVMVVPAELALGAVLGRLSRMADGELVTKVDDDDHYGPHHVTDLVLAWHTSGADLVGKGARFVHLPERGLTMDRPWAAPETFDAPPGGGTLLLSRGTLAQAGGWSHASTAEDKDLRLRIGAAGGLVYRTHALEYVYVRRDRGHTDVVTTESVLAQAERTYPGLPPEIIDPAAAAGTQSGSAPRHRLGAASPGS